MIKITEISEKMAFLSKIGCFRKFLAINIYTGEKHRCSVEDENNVFVYAKRCKRSGYRYTKVRFSQTFNIISNTEDEINAQWRRRIRKAVTCMESSGLWHEIKEKYINILESGMTWGDRCRMDDLYWEVFSPSNKSSEEEKERAYAPYVKKYPFAFYRDDNGNLLIDTFYIWEQSRCILKSMYFGKYQNREIKEQFKKAIEEKRDYHRYRIPVNYDVTLEHKADKAMAWYSEEYRNCGNGHYYLALNHSTALFCEDD